MTTEHRAHITWSQTLVDRGLPTSLELTDPAWIDPDAPADRDGWSLRCTFTTSPHAQGNPSSAAVHFVTEDAPEDRLREGATLRLLERGTGNYASVAILD